MKDRELRAQLAKTTGRKLRDVRGDAKDELNAAVVQTISESQSDLGLKAAASDAVYTRKDCSREQKFACAVSASR